MRWLVTGAHGMLGQDLMSALSDAGEDAVGIDLPDLDLTDPAAVSAYFGADQPAYDVIVNCAAWTAVDDAEEKESLALAVNETAPRLLAAAAAVTGARLVQLSTDYVFDGTASTPYAEDHPAAPASAYGRTKWAGEEAVRAAHPEGHLIVRTAWLYGARGPCFPKTMATLARQRALTVVDDQIGQPTWTIDVAATIIALIAADAPAGTYHATSSGQTSWFGFARAIVAAAGLDPEVVSPTDSSSFVRPAPRPAYSVLGHDALVRVGVPVIGDWAERWEQASASVLAGTESPGPTR